MIVQKSWLIEKACHLFIGAFNAFAGYGVFVALSVFWLLCGQSVHYILWRPLFYYIVILAISLISGVAKAFFCYQIWVFQKIRKVWLNEKIRYLFIGAFNTFFGYGVFSILWLLWGQSLHYIALLSISHVIAVTNAFFCYRILVFRKKGGIWGDFARFNMVYLGAFIFNMLVLPILVETLHIHPLVAQALVVVVTVVASYLLHRRFSFRPNKSQVVKR